MRTRQRQYEGNASQSGIRILTVALFIILLAFFIVLNSIAVIDEKSKLEALGSLIGSFGILPGGLSAMKDEGKSILPPQAPMVSRNAETTELFTSGASVSRPVFIRSTPRGEVVSIHDKLLFDPGAYKIKLSSYPFLKKLCKIINQDQYPVEITGHTDSLPPDEKSGKSNWEISSLRALEVMKFFVFMGKVSPARITAYGCAGYRPIASNDTRQTRALNRRVDVLLESRARGRLEEIYEGEPSRFFVFKRFVFRIFGSEDGGDEKEE
ncbi:MAG: hypothetical protein DRH10_08205 [Deltaproteobacteria bacterium]|nr:MAG: hypothetical protein DRH10_08205 [Deltaproteobacteria bacterium]